MKLSLYDIIATMTDKRCRLFTEGKHWFPFWMFCSVVEVNGKYVISNRPY